MGSVLPQQQLLLRLLILLLLLLLLLLPLLVLLHCARKRSAPFGTKVLPILVNLANLGGGRQWAKILLILLSCLPVWGGKIAGKFSHSAILQSCAT